MNRESLIRLWENIERKPFWFILILSLIPRIIYLLWNHPLWWDAHVYIGIGKYIYSWGKVGIWEVFRPLIHPLFLGAFWKLGLSPIISGKILDLIFSLVDVYLVYLIAKKVFDKRTAIFAALIFSLNPWFIMYTGMILTEPLALFFGLLGVYVFIRKEDRTHLLLSSILCGLAFLTKYPMGIFFGGIGLILIIRKKSWGLKVFDLIVFWGGFLLSIAPYLYLNYALYNNIWLPFVTGSDIVTTATWAYGSGIWFYFANFFLVTPIYLFVFAYYYYFIQDKHWKEPAKLLLTIIPWLVFIYFWIVVPRKEVRYLAPALPFFSILVSVATQRIYQYLKQQSKPWIKATPFVVICCLLAIIVIPTSLNYERVPTFEKEINAAVLKYNITGTILTSDPAFVSYLDNHLILLSGMEFAPVIYNSSHGQYELLFLNDCDLGCAAADKNCISARNKMLTAMFVENDVKFTAKYKNCTYAIMLPR